MTRDKYSATWVSHSSISDYLRCPRAYYLRSIYKNPINGHKMTVITPPLALGAAVHDVIESLASLPVEERFKISLVKKLDPVWLKYSGKKGGFKSFSVESEYRERAVQMLINLQEDPGPINQKAIKIKTEDGLPYYWLNESENIILCGKIDWLSYDETTDSVQIIDFKTGKNEEKEESLQLPIYLLLATNTQSKKVTGATYWYLDRDDGLLNKKLPDLKKSYKLVLEAALKLKEARAKKEFVCPRGGCFNCRPLERVLKGEGELVGVSSIKQDIYFLPD